MAIKQKLSEYKDVITISLAVGGVAVTILNFVILNSLSPVLSHLQKLDTQVEAVQRDHLEIKEEIATKKDIETLRFEAKTRDDDIIHRLDIISARLDRFIGQ